MPAISIVTEEGQTPRLDLQVIHLESEDTSICIISQTTTGSDLELELSKEVRRRLIAEADTAAALRELELANRDLEDFAGIISHDLQAPMRALRFDLERLDDALVASDIELSRTQASALHAKLQRMSSMMTALLDYASRSRIQDVLEHVDTRAVIDDVISSLSVPEAFSIDVTGTWPLLETFRSPLDGILRNLIDNAIKHHDNSSGRIEVHAEQRGRTLRVRVTDDGPGIAASERKAAFLPFRTLSAANPSSSAGEGTGMGLAFVKRLVDGIGGEIELNARRDGRRGTEVSLVWPAGAGPNSAS